MALYVDDITVSFDGFKALNALSLTINVGELRCIIGPNGAGKTTMMDCITGKTRPDAGKVFFGCNIDLLRLKEQQISQIGVGRKFQKPTVYEQLSVFENLELALKADRRVRASLFSRLSGAQLDRIGEVLALIHLKDEAQRTAGLLSHGQKQWLEIGMLLMQDPEAAAARRAGGRHDRRGNRAHGRAVPLARRPAFAGGRRARHEVRRAADARGARR